MNIRWGFVLVALAVDGQSFFAPRFHTPNDRAVDGTPCAKLRPSRTVPCPPFCLRSRLGDWVMSQEEFERRCLGFGDPECECEDWDMNCQCEPGRLCPNGQSLLPNGECGVCPHGFVLEDQGGDLNCRNTSTDEALEFENPCECLNNGKEFYRPCLSRTSVVEEYYKSFDLEGQWTMASCANDRGLEGETTMIDMNAAGNFQTFSFPLLYQNPSSEERDFGFLQCPNEPQAFYSYTTPAWRAYWGYLLFGSAYIAAFAVYKAVGERGANDPCWEHEPRKESRRRTGSLAAPMVQACGTTSDRWQIGFRDDRFGISAFVMVVAFALFHFCFLVFQLLDAFGLYMYTLCPTDVNDRCREIRDSGRDNYYSWRTGFPCAASCLFGNQHSTGQNSDWPYWRKPGGAQTHQVFFAVFCPALVLFFCGLRLLKPHLRSYFRIRCDLLKATTVLVSEPYKKPIVIESDTGGRVWRLTNWAGGMHMKLFGSPRDTRACSVHLSSAGTRYFDFRCKRYFFDGHEFVPAKITVGRTHLDIIAHAHGLTDSEAGKRREVVGKNYVVVKMDSLLTAFFNEGFDYFYFCQFFGLALAYHFNCWIMATSSTTAVIFSLSLQVLTKRSAQFGVKRIAESFHPVAVLRGGMWKTVDSPELVPGDVIRIVPGPVVCDMAIIEGRAVVDESSLTGEPSPVPKIALARSERAFTGQRENAKHSVLSGTTIQAACPGPKGYAAGVVTATGSSAVRGKLLSKVLYPSPIAFKLDQELKVVFWILILIWQFYMYLSCYWARWRLESFALGLAFVIIPLNPLVPAIFVAGHARAAQRLRQYQVFSVEPARTAVAGKVKYACFDKTGTLTQSGLLFQEVLPVIQPDPSLPPRFAPAVRNASEYPLLQLGLATCHELDCVVAAGDSSLNGSERDLLPGGFQIVGNEVDKRMFIASGFEFEDAEELIMASKDGRKKYQILRRFEFDRSTMTMSTIVKDLNSGERMVACKGSGEGIAEMCVGQIPSDYMERVNSNAAEGVYVLGLAYKSYDGPEDVSQCERTAVESNLTAGGIICFRNELKHDTPEVIDVLKRGRVRPIMVTGDAVETAVRIARECGLSTGGRLLIARPGGGSVRWEDYDTGSLISHDLRHLKPQLEANEVEIVVCGDAFDLLSCRSVVVEEMLSDVPDDYCSVSEAKADIRVPETQMDDLLLYTRIFARMKPEQKVKVVSLHMKQGITSMCGDGANDAAALQRAHIGMALSAAGGSSGEVSAIVAHFATSSESLHRFVDLLRVGRGSLATIMHAYKYLIACGQQNGFIQILHYYIGASRGEGYWLHMDVLLNLALTACILESKPSKKLMPHRPTARLLGSETFWSLGVHIVTNWVFVIVVVVLLYQQEWFRCKEYDASNVNLVHWWLKGDNYETSVPALLAIFNCINAALVFNFGFDYRQKCLRNWLVPVFWAASFVYFSCILLLDPNSIGCLYRTNCGDQSLLHWWHDRGWIRPHVTFPTAPEGCPCDEQIVYDDKCEAEYIDCPNSQYNTFYHHNIVPLDWRWKFYFVFLANLAAVIFFEGVVVVGPVRRWIRRRGWDMQHKKEAVGERGPLMASRCQWTAAPLPRQGSAAIRP